MAFVPTFLPCESDPPVQITGLGGAALSEGDIVTGEAALRAVSLQNGLAKVTYELPVGAEPGACHLFIKHGEEWRRCFRPGYGDWSFFAIPLAATANRIVVLTATDDVAEISIEWTALALNIPYLSSLGLVERNHARLVSYSQSQSTPRYITEIHLRKLVRLERGRRGYFAGWHSFPDVSPWVTGHGQAANGDKDVGGERELGTGGGSRVAWASTGLRGYFPAWRLQRDWSAVVAAIPSLDNFSWWPGIEDATYPPLNHATFVAMQPAGFPAESSTPPYYVADIPDPDFGGDPDVVRYIVQRNPNEIAVWNYAGQLGELVNHLTNPWVEADGRKTKYPVFIGAEHYVSDATAVAVSGYTGNVAYGNEPKQAIQDVIAQWAQAITEDWPQ